VKTISTTRLILAGLVLFLFAGNKNGNAAAPDAPKTSQPPTPKPSPATTPIASSGERAVVGPATILDPIIPQGEHILILGDSLSAGFKEKSHEKTLGGQLERLLEDAGAKVITNALGGRSAYTFVKGSGKEKGTGNAQLQEAIDSGITTAIIVLGTNDLNGIQADAKQKEDPATIKAQVAQKVKFFKAIIASLRKANVEVYGVGSPHYAAHPEFWPYEDALNAALASAFGPDHYLDVSKATGDYKMHAQGKSAENFAKRIFTGLTGIQ